MCFVRDWWHISVEALSSTTYRVSQTVTSFTRWLSRLSGTRTHLPIFCPEWLKEKENCVVFRPHNIIFSQMGKLLTIFFQFPTVCGSDYHLLSLWAAAVSQQHVGWGSTWLCQWRPICPMVRTDKFWNDFAEWICLTINN